MSMLLSEVHELLLCDSPLNPTDSIQNERNNSTKIYILLKYLLDNINMTCRILNVSVFV